MSGKKSSAENGPGELIATRDEIGLLRLGCKAPHRGRLPALGGAFLAAAILFALPAAAATKILALGDSLFAGFGLAPADGFTAQLQRALQADHYDVQVINGSVSGDTSADGVSRLGWSLADKPDLVLLELGGNDVLRGLDPERTRANLDTLLSRLQAGHYKTILVGMLAPRNLGPDYAAKFDPIYPDLAKKYGVPLYPFVLDGVALDPKLTQPDGIHPNPQGVAIIVARMLPVIEKALPPRSG
ncbi:MAG TPA: arylesterase [Alphaproteobacteria bacterium]|nr:arylesterase [Alphaproteobacteria bacterium]